MSWQGLAFHLNGTDASWLATQDADGKWTVTPGNPPPHSCDVNGNVPDVPNLMFYATLPSMSYEEVVELARHVWQSQK